MALLATSFSRVFLTVSGWKITAPLAGLKVGFGADLKEQLQSQL
jgi:hypothetical protein